VGKEITVCLSFDFDAISVWAGPRGTKAAPLIARGEFGEVGAERLVDLFDARHIPTTWFIPGHTIDTYPEICRRVASAGHEIGYHGYCHEAPSSTRDEYDERQILERSIECIERISGRPPAGHRLPGGNPGTRWVNMLLEHGFSYDSSMAPRDFEPTYMRLGDVVRTDGPHEFGAPVDLVILPFDWILDDWPYFNYEPHGGRQRLRSPNDVYDIWAAEFHYLHEKLETGVYVLTMHPQCIGKGSRMLMLERLIDYFEQHTGVTFSTMSAVADTFRARKPL
jgi:peptidoglycan/xylan/chitin deacetylase (PgdA/CDA1 family)|tara:strand:- start:1103 stop:1942 length:840 start_codon:yes stop_codon:yes gene_type:complete